MAAQIVIASDGSPSDIIDENGRSVLDLKTTALPDGDIVRMETFVVLVVESHASSDQSKCYVMHNGRLCRIC